MNPRSVFGYLQSVSLKMRCGGHVLAISVLLATLAGCSSTATKIETWEGSPPSASSAATLEAPSTIVVDEVNGRSMTNFLMDDLALNYALLPGENEIVFTYKTIWAKSGVVENGESKVHVVKSEPQVVHFTAEPGAVYDFRYSEPQSRSDAEAMMPTFAASVITAGGDVVAKSSVWSPQQAAARTPVSSSDAIVSGSSHEKADGSALERLKSVWATASEEDKKAFLRWAFE